MEIILLLVPLSLILLGTAGAIFIWAVKRHQFDNLDEHALDVLDDNHE